MNGPIFIECSVENFMHRNINYVNPPVNIALVSSFSKTVDTDANDNHGLSGIVFWVGGQQIKWRYPQETRRLTAEEYQTAQHQLYGGRKIPTEKLDTTIRDNVYKAILERFKGD